MFDWLYPYADKLRVPDEVVDDQGFLRVLPHRHGCDGAFAARFRKT